MEENQLRLEQKANVRIRKEKKIETYRKKAAKKQKTVATESKANEKFPMSDSENE